MKALEHTLARSSIGGSTSALIRNYSRGIKICQWRGCEAGNYLCEVWRI